MISRLSIALVVSALSLLSSYAQSNSDTVVVVGVGDVMVGTDFPKECYLPKYSDSSMFISSIKKYISDTDVAFANLEGGFLDGGELVKHCRDTSVCYAFRTPQKYFNWIAHSGFNLFSLANNHIMDFGKRGADSTVSLINKNGFYTAGIITKPYVIFKKNNVTYGFIASSPNRGTVDFADITYLKSLITKISLKVDVLIVYFHMGAEGSKYSHVTRNVELFYGENRGNPYQFARMAIDAGADVVLASGPHVPRAVDLYKNRFIAYSLGNFFTYSRINLRGINGFAPMLKIRLLKSGDFIGGQIISFKQVKGKGLVFDEKNSAGKLIKALSLSDVPESKLQINNNGIISVK